MRIKGVKSIDCIEELLPWIKLHVMVTMQWIHCIGSVPSLKWLCIVCIDCLVSLFLKMDIPFNLMLYNHDTVLFYQLQQEMVKQHSYANTVKIIKKKFF